MKEPFVLYPSGLHLPEEIKKLIPEIAFTEKKIVGVAVGPATLLNMYSRKKIEAYFGCSKRVQIFQGSKYRDAIVFLNDNLPPQQNQLEMEV